jgi:hypothetical protein
MTQNRDKMDAGCNVCGLESHPDHALHANVYLVTVKLQTTISAPDHWDAQEIVADVLPDDVEFGPRGKILPFEVESITAEKYDEETAARP